MNARRIVTGHDSSGRSQVVSAGPLPGGEGFRHSPGFAAALIWRTDPRPLLAAQPADPTQAVHSVLPAVGGTSAMLVTFPPQGQPLPVDFDPQAAAAELCERLPGLGERFEAEHPGFHRTDSIDYGVLLDGEISLQLDEGDSTLLRPGDVVVQVGTRHAWRNTGNTPARMLFVMVGATR
ncbi:cupin domain-containing protein [Pseudomonas panipatensis]|uniref:Cupin domain-containing protein n=1 Tax=Pseudomonas panipatensis TaxID=428992 RepID=A0A1G8I3B5_9PSED|nr:cupin domain-containing protein [Pseudomonas panipatensis]SDI13456.1 Cupin domain-containing protein [Pseudomonas panipatensis]SMP76207.1 Cupin domain-containing protein [Pseudomonas panipatensis]